MNLRELKAECPALAEHVKANAKSDPRAAAHGVRLMAYELLKLADRIGKGRSK